MCASWPQEWDTPFDRRGERQSGALGDRQGVHVGAQRDPRLRRPEVADDTRTEGEPLRVEPEGAQVGEHDVGRAVLLAGQLGVRVQIASPPDHRVPWVSSHRDAAPVRAGPGTDVIGSRSAPGRREPHDASCA